MRIGIDIRHLCAKNPTGIGYYSLELIERLIESTEFEWTLFASGSKQALRNIPESFLTPRAHVTVHRHREPNRLLNAKLFFGRTTLDELIATPVDAWFFPNLNFIDTEKPYVITAHDLSFELLPECFAPKTRLWHTLIEPSLRYKEAQHIIAVSTSTATDLQTVYGIKSNRMSTIPLAAREAFSPQIQPNDRHILLRYGIKGSYLLMLSSIEPRKNHEGVILAYTRWRAQGGTLPLVIAGGFGYRARATQALAKRSPYSRDILFTRYVHDGDRPTLLRHATALLFPSLYEGFGLPIREAAQCGTPVLTSSNSAMLEHKGSHILHVDPWHIDSLVNGIEAITHIPHNKKPTESFENWDDIAQRTLEVFKKQLR